MIGFRDLGRASLVTTGLLAVAGAAAPVRAGSTERVSVSSNGVTAGGKQGNDASGAEAFGLALSADGRFVGFVSFASNLVPGDTNGDGDVSVRDRLKGTTERVSVSSSGEQVVYGGDDPSLSADGRFVAFVSRASNLVPHDTNDATDVFVRDRETGRTERVSVGPNGHQGNIDSGVNGVAISADGRFVTFPSYATNLVEGGASGVGDIFVRDRSRRVTELVSVGPNGRGGDNESFYATISADGRFVAFLSSATNLVKGGTSSALGIYVRDRARRRTVRVAGLSDSVVGPCQRPEISADGRSVAFATMDSNLVPHDTNGVFDVFVRDRETGRTERVSVNSHGQQADGVGSCGQGISA